MSECILYSSEYIIKLTKLKYVEFYPEDKVGSTFESIHVKLKWHFVDSRAKKFCKRSVKAWTYLTVLIFELGWHLKNINDCNLLLYPFNV